MLEKSNSLFNLKNRENYPDFLKLILLGLTFFFVIGSYSILRPLKSSIFIGLVGKEYIPYAKLFSIINLFPCILLYSKLVDKLKKQAVVYVFFILYAIFGILFTFYFTHPVIGLENTVTSPYRFMGWLFYFLLDLYSPLVVSTFWAFSNSINTPDYAEKNYGKIVAFSRVGGIFTSLSSWLILQKFNLTTTQSHSILVIESSIFLFMAGICIYLLMKKVPSNNLQGYKAAYEAEKENSPSIGLFEGLKLMITKPYVLGIFGLIYSFEVISVILDYQMQFLMSIENNNAITGMSSFMFIYTATFQGLSLIFALFGTSNLLRWIGVKYCIVIMPIATILLMFLLVGAPTLTSIFIILVIIRALNYGFNAPVREILYIPTTKDIKFKSKAWIESFGRSLSKTAGSTFNLLARAKDSLTFIRMDSFFAIGISLIWAITAYLVGKKYNNAILNNEVIGKEDF